MKRRIVKHGPSTLIISIPSKWAKKYNLNPGDEINVIENNDTLTLSTNHINTPLKKITIDTRGKNELSAWWLLPVLHKRGYDEIEIIYDNIAAIQNVKKRIDEMLHGYEIVDQTDTHCTIKNLSGDKEANFDQILRRIFLVTQSLATNSLTLIKNNKQQELKELLVLEQTNNKLTNLCQRLIAKRLYNEEKSQFMYLIIWILESIADHYREIIKTVTTENTKINNKELLTAYDNVNKLYTEYYEAYYNYDLQKLITLRENQRKIYKTIIQLLPTLKGQLQNTIASNLLGLVQRIDDCLGATAAINT